MSKLLKLNNEFEWPTKEGMFYVLTSKGLMICRNHQFYESCVPARGRGPSGLEEVDPFILPNFPVIPRAVFETIVGFFSHVANTHGTEASASLTYDMETKEVGMVIPKQKANRVHVSYEPPVLPEGVVQFGDVHSHVFGMAYPSGTDVHDEEHVPGIHIIVGNLDKDPPGFYAAAVVDQQRFKLEIDELLEEPYVCLGGFDMGWMDNIEITPDPPMKWIEGAWGW